MIKTTLAASCFLTLAPLSLMADGGSFSYQKEDFPESGNIPPDQTRHGSSHRTSSLPFNGPGSGRPTNTAVGAVTGAAAGTAIGQAVGGKDGWWIGTLTGAVLGGAVGNAWPTDAERAAQRDGRVIVTEQRGPRWTSRPVVYRRVEYCPPPQPVVVPEPAVPYGFLEAGGKLRSPWSDFVMDIGGINQGQTVYDPHTGQPFLVP